MTVVEKKCSKCGQSKPKVEFYSNKSAKDGLTHWCKACCIEKERAKRRARGAKEPVRVDRTRPCVVDGCPKNADCSNGMCHVHDARVRRGIPLDKRLRVYKYSDDARCITPGCDSRPCGNGLCKRCFAEWCRKSPDRPRCVVDGCPEVGHSLGMCTAHYKRYKNGRPLVAPVLGRDTAVRVVNGGRVKLCTQCLLTKDVLEFYEKGGGRDGLTAWCKQCTSEWHAGRYAANPDPKKRRARERVDRLRREDPDGLRAYRRAYYAKNRATIVARVAKWVRDNPERAKLLARNSQHRRRARIRGTAVETLTTERVMERMSVYGFRCAYCGGEFEHIDHVKPLSRGGPHILANLRPACAPCNLKKSATDHKEWLGAA